MLSFKAITIRFAGARILDEVSGSLQPGDRVGLVGPNGAGKSTLVRVLAGQENAETGEVRTPNDLSVGYLPQGGVPGSGTTCLDEAFSAWGHLTEIEDQLGQVTRSLSELAVGQEVPKDLLDRYGELEHQYGHRGGYEGESAVLKVLEGLGVRRVHWGKPTSQLSGGLRMRLALAKLILYDHGLLLLDEPTNHLDIAAVEWLEEYLARSPAAQILVSHDRRFLDRLVSEIWELDHGTLTRYRGNYSAYLEARKQKIGILEKRRELMLQEKRRIQEFIDRNRTRKDRARQVQGRIKALKKMEEVNLPPEAGQSTFRIREAPAGDRIVAKLEGVGKAYGDHLIFDKLDLVLERDDRVAVIGPNGAGKSTLLRILTGREQPTCGSSWTSPRNVVRFYSQDEAETLKGRKTVLEEVERAAPVEMVSHVRFLLARFLFCGDDVFKPLDALSGGERSRLALAKLMVEPANVLVLDEPTNHLDLDGQEVLTEAIERYQGALLFVSHDREFVDRLAAKVLEIDGGRGRLFLGNYSDYKAVRLRDSLAVTPAPQEPKRPVEEARPAARPSAKLSKDREKELKELEMEIETIEARLKALGAMAASPAIFRSGSLSKEIAEQQRALRTALPDLYERWDALASG